jgi:hypothetical protein
MDLTMNVPHIVNQLAPIDKTGAGAVVGTPISMKFYDRVVFLIQIGVLTGTDAMTVTLHQGTVVGTVATALTIKRAWKCTTNDTWTAIATPATVTITDGVDDGGMIAIEVQAQDLDVDSGDVCIELNITAPGTHAALMSAVALCFRSRFGLDPASMKTAITD